MYFFCISYRLELLVSVFNEISTFVGYLMPKPSFEKNRSSTSWEYKGVHAFAEGMCLKVNIIVRLKFELEYHDSEVRRFNRYTTRTSSFTRLEVD